MALASDTETAVKGQTAREKEVRSPQREKFIEEWASASPERQAEILWEVFQQKKDVYPPTLKF